MLPYNRKIIIIIFVYIIPAKIVTYRKNTKDKKHMLVEVSLLIAAVSLGFSIYTGVANMKRNKSSDDKKDASETTTVIVKLENIQSGISEIKADMKDMKREVKEAEEKIVRLDESLKSAWRAINKIQGNGE